RLGVLTPGGRVLEQVRVPRRTLTPVVDPRRPLMLAGRSLADGRIGDHFNGRIERPLILHGSPDLAAVAHCAREPASAPPGEIHACWDFAIGMESWTVQDIGPHGLHGRLLNTPKRAVRGVRWSGPHLDWRQCPEEYGAIHFHEDDLDDARWAPSLS